MTHRNRTCLKAARALLVPWKAHLVILICLTSSLRTSILRSHLMLPDGPQGLPSPSEPEALMSRLFCELDPLLPGPAETPPYKSHDSQPAEQGPC